MEDAARESFDLEEVVNCVTHGVGLVASVVGLAVLVALAYLYGSAWHMVSCAIFGLSLVALYAASTLYHSFRSPRAKHTLKILDHAAIYLLIAGTYTPFTLVNMRGFWGWTLFTIVWALAIIGIVFKLFFVNRFVVASTIFYVLMGWVCVIAIKPLMELVPRGALLWLLAGGIFYTLGTIFFACSKIPFNHAIWHLFVLAGSLCHYFAVVFYVLL